MDVNYRTIYRYRHNSLLYFFGVRISNVRVFMGNYYGYGLKKIWYSGVSFIDVCNIDKVVTVNVFKGRDNL